MSAREGVQRLRGFWSPLGRDRRFVSGELPLILGWKVSGLGGVLGTVYGKAGRADGTTISTSPLWWTRGPLIVTATGHGYLLGAAANVREAARYGWLARKLRELEREPALPDKERP